LVVPNPRIALKLFFALAVFLLAAMSTSAKLLHKSAPAPPPSPGPANYQPVNVYDMKRDPAKDLQDAIAAATQTKKHILLEVGGDWCVYCNIMDTTFDSHPALKRVRDANYVTVKINYSKENPNDSFLSHYPRIVDYPHFFVLDSKGVLVHSQPTHPFEHGTKYNVSKIDVFLKKWSEPPHHLLNSRD
jgi:thiol:disulfide interchange protein